METMEPPADKDEIRFRTIVGSVKLGEKPGIRPVSDFEEETKVGISDVALGQQSQMRFTVEWTIDAQNDRKKEMEVRQ